MDANVVDHRDKHRFRFEAQQDLVSSGSTDCVDQDDSPSWFQANEN